MSTSGGFRVKSQIPAEILNDDTLNQAIKFLPSNYNFEIHKTVWKVRSISAKSVALQFPEGLLMYACVIGDILRQFCPNCDFVVMADVTYGACCVDDFTAKALGCDLLVHYGHSCLVPVQETQGIAMLYIFVDIKFDTQHLIETLKANFQSGTKLALISTVQFVSTLQVVANELKETFSIKIPQAKPLSPGEVLGCTAPTVPKDVDSIIYVGDGRFHLEASMIANHTVKAYKYDPYSKELTRELYDYPKMVKIRRDAVERAKNAQTFGLILGALGRQGNPRIFDWLTEKVEANGKKCVLIVLSEIFPDKLKLFDTVDCFVQVACPRLSIDWGGQFPKPLLTPYEAAVVLKASDWKVDYPMDFYSNESLGPWTNKHVSYRSTSSFKMPRKHVSIEQTT